MHTIKNHLIFAAILAIITAPSTYAATTTLTPVSDGDIQFCGDACAWINTTDTRMIASSGIQAIIKFSPTIDASIIESASISLYSTASIIWANEISIYGYGTSDAGIGTADRNAGDYLGTFQLPPEFAYGKKVYFDVTSFVKSVSSPYIAFNIRASNSVSMGTLESSGGPSELVITTSVPEPGSGILAIMGIFGIFMARRRITQEQISQLNTMVQSRKFNNDAQPKRTKFSA